jgi:hypothetical protein
MEYYSAIKNEIISFAEKWVELEVITLNEIGQDKKACFHLYVESRTKL